MELNIRELIFVEDIKKRYKLKENWTIKKYIDEMIISSNKFNKFEIVYYSKLFGIRVKSVCNFYINFKKYEDMIEIVDMFYNSKNIYYTISEIVLQNINDSYIEHCLGCIFIMCDNTIMRFEEVYLNDILTLSEDSKEEEF
jgi:hypothetical protein